MATHSSILAWRIPWTEESGGLQSIGSQRVEHHWSNLACINIQTGARGKCISFLNSNKDPVLATRNCTGNNIIEIYILRRIIFELNWVDASVQFSSVAQSCLTLCDPMNRSTPSLPVYHQLPEFTQTRFHRVSDAIQPSHPPSSPSPPAPNPSQHQSLFQWMHSSGRKNSDSRILTNNKSHKVLMCTSRCQFIYLQNLSKGPEIHVRHSIVFFFCQEAVWESKLSEGCMGGCDQT